MNFDIDAYLDIVDCCSDIRDVVTSDIQRLIDRGHVVDTDTVDNLIEYHYDIYCDAQY